MKMVIAKNLTQRIATDEPYPKYLDTVTGADIMAPHDRVRWLASGLESRLPRLISKTDYPSEKALLIEYHEALLPLFQQFMDDRRAMIDAFIEINGEFTLIDSYKVPDDEYQHPILRKVSEQHVLSGNPLLELVRKATKLVDWVDKRKTRIYWGLPDGEFDEVSGRYPLGRKDFE